MTKLQKIKFNEAVEYAMHILDTSRIDERDKDDLREAIELVSISGGGETRIDNDDVRSLVHGYVVIRSRCLRGRLDCNYCPLARDKNGNQMSCSFYVENKPEEAEEKLVEYLIAHPEILNKKEKEK